MVAAKLKKLYNGVEIPEIGFGTIFFNGDEPRLEDTEKIIVKAVKAGYRHFDTAESYDNEEAVGNAIKKCIDEGLVKREELFITTKLSIHRINDYQRTVSAFNKSLKLLQLDYIDQYLLHGPAIVPDDSWKEINAQCYRAIEDIYNEGKVKSIGVSNFMIHHLETLFETARVKPMINQLELHPKWQQREVVDFCKKHNILCSAWAPLMHKGGGNIELIEELAEKYNKTCSQICLKWSLQKGFVPLPKTSSYEHMTENLDLYDFELNENDIKKIDKLNSHPMGLKTPDSFYLVYSLMEETKTQTIKESWKLFNKIRIMKILRKNENDYIYYFLGFIPFMRKKILSKTSEKIYLFGVQLFTITKTRKLIGLRDRIPKR